MAKKAGSPRIWPKVPRPSPRAHFGEMERMLVPACSHQRAGGTYPLPTARHRGENMHSSAIKRALQFLGSNLFFRVAKFFCLSIGCGNKWFGALCVCHAVLAFRVEYIKREAIIGLEKRTLQLYPKHADLVKRYRHHVKISQSCTRPTENSSISLFSMTSIPVIEYRSFNDFMYVTQYFL